MVEPASAVWLPDKTSAVPAGTVMLPVCAPPPPRWTSSWWTNISLVFMTAVILVAIVMVSVLDGDDNEAAVLQPSPTTDTRSPTPTMPPQTPTTPPATPPPLEGEAVTTATGLQYIDIVVGTGAAPVNGDVVAVNYTGWLASDGTKFDSSLERESAFGFTMGTGQVIPGWDEGLLTMQKGGQRRLIIPPELAYGADGRPPTIPPNSTLIFDIALIDVFPAAATPTPAAATPSPAAEVSPSP